MSSNTSNEPWNADVARVLHKLMVHPRLSEMRCCQGELAVLIRAQLSASQKRCEELELFIHATTAANEMAAPLYVQDEPERGKGWACYYHDERYLFIPADERGLPVIDESIRAELERARMRTSQP